MYTIEIMSLRDHTEDSWEALFNREDEDRRNYKLMYDGHAIEFELTYKEARKWKMHYEREDAYASMDAYDFEPETKQ